MILQSPGPMEPETLDSPGPFDTTLIPLGAQYGAITQIGQLLLDKDRPLRQSEEGSAVRTVARARTLAVLRRLDGNRRGTVVQFLYEARLIEKDSSVVDLTGAVLARAILTEANLKGANLRGTHLARTSLREAKLSEADLSDAKLFGADLRRARMDGANLRGAVLMSNGSGEDG
jgi:hypothetical protein